MAAALANVTFLFFDVFGTTAAQRGPVADALWSAAQVVLESNVSTVNPDILEKAKDMTYDQWFDIGGTWFSDVNLFTSGIENVTDDVPWRSVDGFRIADLPKVLANEGLVILREEGNNTVVAEGSLFNQTELETLGLVWHRLPPWPDTNHGLDLLNKKYNTSGLSNTYQDLLKELVMHGRIPLDNLYTSEEFHSFKPRPAVYLGAAAALGVQPEQCALVAAHLKDLQGAKNVGFHTIYVERPLEELNPELFNQGIQDLQVNMDQEGFITLAHILGIQDD